MGMRRRGDRLAQERRADDVERILAQSLRLIYIPVAVLLLGALGAFVYATFVFVDSVRQIVHHAYPVGHNIGLFFSGYRPLLDRGDVPHLRDRFVRAVHQGDQSDEHDVHAAAWLEMRDLNQLKARIIAMIVLVLSVSFVEVIVDAPNGRQALELGSGIAVIIIALTVFVRLGSHGGDGD